MISSALGSVGTAIIFAFGVGATWSAYVEGAYKPTTTNVPTWIVVIVIPVGSLLLASPLPAFVPRIPLGVSGTSAPNPHIDAPSWSGTGPWRSFSAPSSR